MTPVRVVLAEDNLLVREGLVALLRTSDEVELVGVAEDLPGLIEAVDAHGPDVVLTDIRMPGVTGLDEAFGERFELGRRRHGVDVDPRGHHRARHGVGEFDHPPHPLALGLFEDSLAPTDGEKGFDLFLARLVLVVSVSRAGR